MIKIPLLNLLKEIANEQGFMQPQIELEPLLCKGENYTSELFVARVEQSERDHLKLFVKVSCFGERVKYAASLIKPYEKELSFYTKLVPIYKKIEEENGVEFKNRMVFPKYYGGTVCGQETIVLENLFANGFETFDRLQCVDWLHASKTVEQLATFHALSMAFELHFPEEFNKFCVKNSHLMLVEDFFMPIYQSMATMSLEVVSGNRREKLKRYLDENMNTEAHRKMMSKARRNALMHGDMKLNNLLHKTDEGGNIQIIIVDFQTIYKGCPVIDLLYFIFISTDEEFRSKHLDSLIKLYHRQLTLALQRLGCSQALYSEADFEHDVREMLPLCLNMAIFALPFITVDTDNVPTLGDEDMPNFTIKPSALYRKRITGILNDFFKRGVL